MNTEICIKDELLNKCINFDRYLVVGGSGDKVHVMGNVDYNGMIMMLAPLIEILEKHLENLHCGSCKS